MRALFLALLLLSVSFAQLEINFTDPTPADNSTLYSDSIYVNTSIPNYGETTIYDNWNGNGVSSGATRSENWTITEPKIITYLYTYHYGGSGAAANMYIRRANDSAIVWQGNSSSGTFHFVYPYVQLPAGTYYCTDDADAWSYNDDGTTGGFLRVDAKPVVAAFIDFNRSLVGYWSFDNISGNMVYDSSTYGNNGTNYGAVNASGMFGNSLIFDGVDDYIEVPHNETLDLTGDFTFTAWIKTSYTGSQTIHSKHTSNQGWEWDVESPYVGLYTWGSGADCQGSISVIDGNWHFVVAVARGNICEIWIDGTLDAQEPFTGSYFGNTGPLWIGTYQLPNGWFFNGSIDEIQIWNRALSEEEINASYNAGLYKLERNFTNLNDGNYSFYAYAIDLLGNYSTTETRNVEVLSPPFNGSISACMNITQPGDYILVQDISSSGTCIRILSDNVNLDCQGFTINGPGGYAWGAYGIYLNGKENSTIKNCVVMDFEEGISLEYSSSNILTNITASSNADVGIYLYGSNNNNLTNNNASSNLWFGIYIHDSSNNIVANNTATLNIDTGIYLYGSNNNNLTNNTVSSNRYGIHTDHSSANNIITNNNASSNTIVGIYIVSYSNSNVISNSTSCNNTVGGYYFDASSTNNIGSNNKGNKTDDDNNSGFSSSPCTAPSVITKFTFLLRNKLTAQLYLSAISLDGMNFVFSPPVYFPPAQSKLVSFNTSEVMCEYPGQILEFNRVIFYYKQGAIEDIAQVGSIPLIMKCA